MSTSNPIYGVGGTAPDGGLSTADTVRDGGVDGGNRAADGKFTSEVDTSKTPNDPPVTRNMAKEGLVDAKTSNPLSGVGGTAQDGGMSTAASVADGGPNSKKADPTYQPSS